jgi:SSS family solute:Na+ symporter
MTPRQHIWALRCAIIGVAVFAFCFSTFFKQTQYIQLWWLLTAAIFIGGAGAAIIGGLYWRKGTTSAAWAAAITGSTLGFGGIMCGHFWSSVLDTLGTVLANHGIHLPAKFWFNDQVSGFIAALTAATTYIVVSLLTCSVDFDLERMLHRGKYSIGDTAPVARSGSRFSLRSILKFDENFTTGDKLIAGGIFAWTMVLAAINLIAAIWNLAYSRWPVSWWANYWLILAIGVPFAIAVVTLVWFTIAGIADMSLFFVALKTRKADARDDGRVAGHANLVDEPVRISGFPVRISGEENRGGPTDTTGE